uniref:Odorant binding protein n=1 Tax=Heliothis virescens TaxID=7102 RepID=A0A2A4K7T5_HELVI
MCKLTCLLLAAVAVIISNVNGDEEGRAAFRQAMGPLVMECSNEFGVTGEDMKNAQQNANPEALNPCFIGCVFKKFGIMTSSGTYDADASLAKIRAVVQNDELYAKLKDIGEKCNSVNDASVSDGDAGCERAALLAKCFMDNKSEISI